jgi:hypothetical protein
MESAVPFSSYWGKLKSRKLVTNDVVRITVGSHSFYVSRDDKYLPILKPNKTKEKVFIAVEDKERKRVFVAGTDKVKGDSHELVTICDVTITDSYYLASRLHRFWSKYGMLETDFVEVEEAT